MDEKLSEGPTTWEQAALSFGELLASVGPKGYYNFTPAEWLKWASSALRSEREKKDGSRVIELGMGKVKIEPCFVSAEDRRQAILFEPVDEPHEIGILTGDPAGPHVPQPKDTLLILGGVESAKVLAEQLSRAIKEMEKLK